VNARASCRVTRRLADGRPDEEAPVRTSLRTTGALTAAAILGAALAADAQTTRSGRDIYEATCAACHGTDGRGGGAVAADYPVIPPDLTDCAFATREPTTDWGVVTRHGGPARAFTRFMPAFGEALTAEELRLAVSHVQTFCADPAWPRGELNMPRPLVTTKAFPENEAVATVAAGGGAVTQKFSWEQRLGPRNMFEITAPVAFSERTPGDWTGGVGDLAFAFKRALAHSSRRGTILSAAAELIVPTGSTERGVGSGTTALEPFIAFGQRLPANTFLQAQVGGAVPFDRSHADEAFWRAAFGYQHAAGRYRRTIAPMVEIVGARELASGAPTHWDAVPQVQVALSTRQHVRINVGARVPVNERTGRSTQYMSYLLWEWVSGGFFTGW
jgi:mono/diheme cytochrome c family protein